MADPSVLVWSKSVSPCVIRLDKSSSDVSIFFIRLSQSAFRISAAGCKEGAMDTKEYTAKHDRECKKGRDQKRIDGNEIVQTVTLQT